MRTDLLESHRLPLDSILIMLSELRPKVLDIASDSSDPSSPTNKDVLSFLKSVSLSGLLPPSPQTRPRKFTFSPQSITWLASLAYGSIYLSSLELLRELPVLLFGVERARRVSAIPDLVEGVASFVMSKVGKGVSK